MCRKDHSKYSILAFATCLLAVNSQGFSKYLNDYGNGNYGYGYDNIFNGQKNTWIGNENKIQGQGHYVYGDRNDVAGKNNKIKGYDNRINGQGNQIHGQGNIVEGQGNVVISDIGNANDFDFGFDMPDFSDYPDFPGFPDSKKKSKAKFPDFPADFPRIDFQDLFNDLKKERTNFTKISSRRREKQRRKSAKKLFDEISSIFKRPKTATKAKSRGRSSQRNVGGPYWDQNQRDWSLANYDELFERYAPKYSVNYYSPYRR